MVFEVLGRSFSKMVNIGCVKGIKPTTTTDTKVLVNRIKPFLERIIGTPQKGFFLRRQILDAMITTHEIVHSMEKNKRLGMAFKLDISKAYDKVTWDFLYDVL